ncbi:MAG TPA: phosphoribosyl-ATP diphosphatase [Paludibacteraceae bacterium]|nr:phosphoribosyl-ATP diphosphatase [Paludibacteraceae bacterium]HQF51298.1 phosphoribosyl-ATP diphosphatase [Paludibacteraceae bacterium]HQJ89356.1 phosphoribosyl-ATP diphosphatase [Paludibacteraceae bacterium]
MDINFSGTHGLVQAVVQDERTNKILRVGYIDESTWKKMENEKLVCLFSADHKQSEVVTGGEYNKPLALSNTIVGEDGAAVILMANPDGSTTGADQFLGNKNFEDLSFLSYLQDFIEKRKREMPEGSYTTKLFSKGVNKISQKVGEEVVETIIEATNGTKDQFIYESSDLIYHLIVLLTEKGVRIEDLARELKARHKE